MTPREVIPAEISEEVEAEVSTALHKMVADERRYAGDRIEKLEAALRELSCKCTSNCDWERGDICPSWIACKALEGKDD